MRPMSPTKSLSLKKTTEKNWMYLSEEDLKRMDQLEQELKKRSED